MPTKRRQIKLFNGGDWNRRGGHLYIGAWSRADAARLYCVAVGHDVRGIYNHMTTHWSLDCWGQAMSGVAPERGVWWHPDRAVTVIRLVNDDGVRLYKAQELVDDVFKHSGAIERE